MTTVTTANWVRYYNEEEDALDMAKFAEPEDGNDTIDLRSLNTFMDIRGGKGDDKIWGSTNKPNILSGDYCWSIFGDELVPELYYSQITGDDEIHGGNIFNVIHGGPGNDKLYGGKGINVYSFKLGDSNYVSQTGDIIGDVIYPSGGSDYLYFTDVDYNDLYFFKRGDNLVIQANYEKSVSVTINNFFKQNTIKGIFDKNTDLTRVQEIINTEYASTNVFVNDMKQALNDIAAALPPLMTTIQPAKGQNIINIPIDNNTPFQIYTINNVSSSHQLQIGEETDLEALNFSKSGNDLYIVHQNNGMIILKNYFTKSENNALNIINGVSLKEYTFANINDWGYINDHKIRITQRDNKVTNLAGTFLGDDISVRMDASTTVNAGNGNDIISIDNTRNNTITGGAGENIVCTWCGGSVYHADENHNANIVNTINLTKGEKLTIMSTVYKREDAENISDVVDIQTVGNDGVITIKGRSLANPSQITLESEFFDATEKIIIKNLANNNFAESVKFELKVVDNHYDTVMEQSYDLLNMYWKKEGVAVNNRGVTLNGTALNDEFTGTEFADRINGNAGNDLIHGTKGYDTISGGLGNNIIKYESAFDTDTVNLTKNENLTIDLTTFGFANKEDLKNNLKTKGANLEITVPGMGKIILANFASSNIVGPNGKVEVKLDNNTFVNLNDENIIRYYENDYTSYNTRNNTAAYTGTRFSETVSLSDTTTNNTINTQAGDDKIVSGSGNDTINAGQGDDTITGGKGNDTITGGAGNDTFIFSKGDGVDTITDAVKGDVIQINAKQSELRFMRAGNNLAIGYVGNTEDKITINNYFNNRNKIEDIQLLNEAGTALVEKKIEDILPAVFDITGKGGINGTNNGETIYGSEINDSINAQGGDDIIYAGEGNDYINGGAGNDTIYGQKGNDTIIGGLGTNTVVYNRGDGNDTINLTRGENFTLDLKGITSDELTYDFVGGALLISYDNSGTKETIKINNFGNSDVTNNSTRTTEDTSSVVLTFNGANAVDLRTKLYDITPTANYTGNWHNENITANLANPTRVNKDKAGNIISEIGININAGAGNDFITGSKYNDTIAGGAGENTIVVKNEAFGTDTINLTKDEKLTLDLTSYHFTGEDDLRGKLKVNGKNLELTLGDNGKLVLSNFALSNVVGANGYVKALLGKDANNQNIIVDFNELNVLEYNNSDFNKNGQFTGSRFNETITAENIGKGTTITGGAGNNVISLSELDEDSNILPSNYVDTITGGNDGNSIMVQKNGNKTITTGNGADDITIMGDGVHTINAGNGENFVDVFGKGKATITTGADKDIIYVMNNDSTTTINAGNGENEISVSNSGDNTITTGKDADEITVYDNISKTTIKAGAGKNTIIVNNNGEFGTIILNEENVNAKNIIKFNTAIDESYTFIKEGNNLKITNETSTLVINSYYLERTAKTKYAEISFMIGDEDTTYEALRQMTGKLVATSASGNIKGSEDADLIYASTSNDTINSYGGDDVIYAGAGNDTINAGDGDDKIYGEAGNDIITGGKGTNRIIFSGAFGNDTVNLTQGENLILDLSSQGLSADDIAYSYSGNNLVVTTPNGKITLNNFASKDVTGEDGSVKLQLTNFSSQNIDLRTKVYSLTSKANINGTWHNENIDVSGAAKGVTVNAGDGNDTITGSNGNDIIYGGKGSDVINGGSGSDTIYAGTGKKYEQDENDTTINTIIFDSNCGNDTIIPDGELTFLKFTELDTEAKFYENITASRQVNDLILNYGDNKITVKNLYLDNNQYDIHFKVGNKNIFMTDFFQNTEIETLGTSGNDTIQLGYEGNTVRAGAGNDTIIASGGNNTIYGEAGNDTISTGYGNDNIYGGLGDDDIQTKGGQNEIHGDDGNDKINTGSGSGNQIFGGAGVDIIHAEKSSNDTIEGGIGNDTIYAGDSDTIILGANCGNDIIDLTKGKNVKLKFSDVASISELEASIVLTKQANDYNIQYGTNKISLKNLSDMSQLSFVTNSDSISLVSYIDNNPVPMYGTSGRDILDGTSGNDTIYGYGGMDTIRGYNGNDALYGGDGDDQMMGGNGDDTIFGEAGNDNIEGNSGNDIINGGAGSNTIWFSSGDGDDRVVHGGGTDELYFTNEISKITMFKSENDLVIYYGSDSVTVENYYTTKNHSVKYINVGGVRRTVTQAWDLYGKEGGTILSKTHTSNHMGAEQTVIIGADGGKTITATSQTNQIFGGDGSDTIVGGSDRDDIYGGDGDDYIRGGAGADRLWGGAGANTFEFRSGDGADIIYEFGADNTLYFPDVTSFSQLNLETSAGSLLSGWHGRNWTQQIMTITGYGNNDSVNMYNSGYENYKIKIKGGATLLLSEFIKQYHPEVASFVTENLSANEGSAFGGTQYVPTNIVPELKPAGYVVQGNADTTVYSGGSITGYGSPSITGGNGNDTIFAGINEQGEKIFYYKQDPYANPVQLEGYNEWGYARLCYKIERDAQGNPIVESTNDDGSQKVKTTQEIKVGGYFYTYTASIEYSDMTHNPDTEDWWDNITLTCDELRTYYNQYLAQKTAGATIAGYEPPIDWNESIDGANNYYDSFTQYKSFSGSGTYEVKVNYYKPENVNEEFATGFLTETFTTTYKGREVTMVISKQQVGTNFYSQMYPAYGYGLSVDNVSVDGGVGNDTIYTSSVASGGEGDDTIYTQGGASGDEGNDKLIAFHDNIDGYNSQNFDGGAGYDMIDLSQTQMNTEANEYHNIEVRMSEGVDTVFFNKNNPNAVYNIYSDWYRPDPNARAIETRYAGYDNYQAGYLKMGDDFVLMNHNQYGGSAVVLKDYYNETLDSIRNDIAITVPVMFAVSRYPECPEFLERYGLLGLQPDTDSGLPHMDQWLGVSATDGNKLYLNAVDYFDNDGQQHAGSFTIFTKNGQKYTTHTAAFDAQNNEKAVNFLSNGNVLYKTITGYNDGNPEYITKTILNKTEEGVTSYYVEDWTMNYNIPFFNENVTVNMDVQYGTNRYENRMAQNNGYYNQKGVVYTFDQIDVYQATVGGQTSKNIGKGYNQITVYEEEDGRKYTVSYVDGYYQKDNQGNYVKDEQGNNIWVDGYYQKDYLETNVNGNFILEVKVGTYSHMGEHGETMNEDIIATITIHRNVLDRDAEGNLQFTANVGDGENVTPVTYTIKKDAELALRTDENGYVWYKKIIGQQADGNNEVVEVKIGKVNAQGIFTELYGDTDLFNQKTFYEREDIKAALANQYLTWEYQQNDFLIGGVGSQTIKAGDGDDTIYGANIPTYDEQGNLTIDDSGDNLYGEDGTDYIVGGNGNDFIDGGEGADYILAGEGDDTIIGGRGIKYTRPAGAYDNVELVGDVIYGEGGDDTIYSVGKYDNEGNFDEEGSRAYLGKYAHDLEGSDHVYQKNTIYGGDGSDTIIVNGWSDTVDAGAGNDTIDLYSKYDPMYYKEGDPLYANQNEYVIDGGEGDDTINLHGEMFVGEVNGGGGNDTIDARELVKSELPNIKWNYTPSGVNINGGAGNDLIHGSSGNDQLSGGDGDDTVYGYGGNDEISVGQELYYRGKSYAYGGDGDDTLQGGGASYLDGGDGNDTIHFATGQTGRVIVPTTLTIDGGSGDDTYIEGDGYSVGYGYDTIIASSGNDKIIFNNVSSNSFSMYRNGNDLCIKHAADYAIVGGGVPFENILILKDYYNYSNKIYGDEHNRSAKELFDNYTIVLKNDKVTRGTYKLSTFIDYTTGVINIITNGVGTNADDFIEAGKTVTDINGYGGDDNIIAGEKTDTISGGSGNDTILGTDRKDVQFITGDNGKVTGVAKEYATWNSETEQYEFTNYKKDDTYYETGFVNYTYTPGDISNDGDDNITLYADKNYVWGEGGDDTINIVGDSSYNFIWGGDGNDTIHSLPTYYSQGSGALYDGGAGNDTIIGNAEWIDGGSGDDVIKAQNNTGMNYENRLRMLVDLYNKKGINTDEALEIRQAILNAGDAIRSAVQDKKTAQSNLESDYYGYPKLARLQQDRVYDAEQVAQYQQKVDQLDPDYVDSLTDYYRNNLAEAKSSLAQHEASIATCQAYIDEQEAKITAANATIAEKQAFTAQKIAELTTKGYEEFVNSYSADSGTSLVFGGEGNDEITLGFDEDYIDETNEVNEPAYQGNINGNYYVRGGAGDDTYIIPDYYYEDEKTGEVTHDFNLVARIEDTQGTNRLVLQSQDLDSAGVGVLMNVELDKDENGNYITDEHGNYSYHYKNFQTRVSDSDRAPLGGGDMEYCIVITDAKTYAEGNADYYGGLYKAGLRFSYETLQSFDRIQASDGKYIDVAQIDKAAQNVANWLGEHDYPDYQYAVGLEEYVDWEQSNINKAELLGSKGFGSIEWLDDNNPATSGVIEGTEGTYLSDKLTSTGANETFNLGTGNDTVTFTGEFGNDVVTSESLVDVDGNAVQSDTLNFKEYSIKDGTLKIEVDPDDANSIKFTAYGEDGSVKGTVIYQDVINSNYSSRKIYINDADGENQLVIEDAYKTADTSYDERKSKQINNSNIGSSSIYISNSSGQVVLFLDGNMNYNNAQADENTTMIYRADTEVNRVDDKDIYTSAKADIATSLGETDDTYTIRFTDTTNATITDMGGNDTLYLYNTGNSSSWKQSQEIRLFFDVDYKGNVSDSLNIVHADKLLTEDAQNVANLLKGEHTMTGVITVNGEIETIETRDKTSRWYSDEDNINITKWKEKIAENIKNWLVMNGYKDVGSALATGNKAVISAVLNFYNMTYAEATGKGNTTVSILSDKASMNAALMSGTQGADVVNIPNNLDKDLIVNTYDGSDSVMGTVDGAKINTGFGNDAVDIIGKNNHISGGAGNDSMKVTAGAEDTNYFHFAAGAGKDTISGTGKMVLTFEDTAINPDTSDWYNPDKSFTLEKRDNDLTIKHSSYDSVTIENYYNNTNNYTMIDKYGDEMLVKDFITSYIAEGNEVTVQNNTTFNYTGDVDRVIIPEGASGYTYNLSGGADTVKGVNICNTIINGGSDNDDITISGTGNTINPYSGDDTITISGVGETSENTIYFGSGYGKNLLRVSNSDIIIELQNGFKLSNLRLRKIEDRLIIQHTAETNNGIAIEDYFNNEVENANYTIKDSDGNHSLAEFVQSVKDNNAGVIPAINEFTIASQDNNVISETQNYDVVGTDGNESILVTEKNTLIDLAGGNDTVNIANSAGGNIITIPYGGYEMGQYASTPSLTQNTAVLNFNDTTVNFSTSGDDLIITSEDMSAPITIKDFVVSTKDKQPTLIVKDKDKTYQVNAGYGISSSSNWDSANLYWENDTYNHVAIYNGTYNGNDLNVNTNGKENVVYVSGGMQSNVYYRNADGLLTVTNTSSDATTGPYMDDTYSIYSFTPNSGVLINDAGGRDDLSFSDAKFVENVVRIFFDVKKVNDDYVADMKEQENGAYNLILVHKDALDADNLLAALDEDWKPQHTGIIKYNGFGDNTYTNNNQEIPNDEINMYQTYKKSDVDNWVSKITSQVGEWLTDNNFDSVTLALQNGTEAQKAELLGLYDYRIDNHYYDMTEGNDITIDETANNDTVEIKVGVNNLIFGENFGHDKLVFKDYDSTYEMNRIDNLNFTQFSLEDGTLSVARGKDSEGGLNKEIIFTAQDGSSVTYNAKYTEGNSQYGSNNVYTNEDIQVNVADKNRIYSTLIRQNSDYNNIHDWTSASEADKNHLAILKGEHSGLYNYFFDITSNDKHNVIVSEGGARLVYTHNGGNDVVNSKAENANDMYKINTFSASSSLEINDAGGNDMVVFKDINMSEMRLFFDVTKSSNYFFADEEHLTLMHKDVAENLVGDWANIEKGVIKLNGFEYEDTFKNNDENVYMSLWIDKIRENVGSFLEVYNYESTRDVFASGNATHINKLLTIYNGVERITEPNNHGDYQGSDAKNSVIIGTAEDDMIRLRGGNNIVVGGKGNDTISLAGKENPNAENYEGTTIYYNYVLGDDKDEIWGATDKDTLSINLGGQDVPMRFINYGGNLVIVFAAPDALDDTAEIYKAFKKSITIRDYFKTNTSAEANNSVIDNVIIDGVDKSLAELINENYGVVFENNTGIEKPTTVDRIIAGTTTQAFGNGANVIYANNEGNTIACNDGDDIVYGGAGNDTINGGIGNNIIYGYGGNDTIHSGCLGQTEITGGKGNDTITINNFVASLALEADQVAYIDEQTGLISAYVDVDGNITTQTNSTGTKNVGYVVEDRRNEGAGVNYFALDADARRDAVKVNYDYTNGGDGNDVIYIGYDVNYRREQQLDSIYINLGSNDITIKNLKVVRYEGNVQHQDLVIQFYDKDGKRDENNSIKIVDYFARGENSRLKHVWVNTGNGYVERSDFLRVLNQETDWTRNQDLFMHSGSGDIGGGLWGDDNIYIDEGAHNRIIFDCTKTLKYQQFENEEWVQKEELLYGVGGTDTIYNSTNANRLRINYNGEEQLQNECQRRNIEGTQTLSKDLEINFYINKDGNPHYSVGNIILKDYFAQKASKRITVFYINDDEEAHKVSFKDSVEALENIGGNGFEADLVLTDDSPIYVFNTEDFENKQNGESFTITSDGETNAAKTISFANSKFAFGDNNLEISYEGEYTYNQETDQYEFAGITDNIKISAIDEDGDKETVYSISYKDYLADENNNLIIQDKNNNYNVSSYNNARQIDLSNNDNHIVFIQDEAGQSTVTSGGGNNIIQTNGGANLTYTYNGGCDSIGTQSETSDDTYNVELAYNKNDSTGTALNIYDAGGDDKLNILSSLDDVRLMFNVELERDEHDNVIYTDGKPNFGIDNTIMLIHKDTLNKDTIISAASGENQWTSGVISIEATTDENGFGIETVKAGNTVVETSVWASEIGQEVASWLSENGYESSSDVLSNPKNDGDVAALIAEYNKTYDAVISNMG